MSLWPTSKKGAEAKTEKQKKNVAWFKMRDSFLIMGIDDLTHRRPSPSSSLVTTRVISLSFLLYSSSCLPEFCSSQVLILPSRYFSLTITLVNPKNDDGPPGPQSPYIYGLYRHLTTNLSKPPVNPIHENACV